MAQYPGEIKSITLATVAGESETDAFWVPRGTVAMTIIAPNLTTDTAYVLQIATPSTLQGGTETWTALSAHQVGVPSAAGSAVSIADNTATMVYPAPAGATCRIAFTTAQAASFTVIFHE